MTDASDRAGMPAASTLGFYRQTLDWLAYHHTPIGMPVLAI